MHFQVATPLAHPLRLSNRQIEFDFILLTEAHLHAAKLALIVIGGEIARRPDVFDLFPIHWTLIVVLLRAILG